LGNIDTETVCGLGEKMSSLGAMLLGMLVASLVVGSLYWYTAGEPQSIIDSVKSKLSIVAPYDIYEECYAVRISNGWWNVIINTMDVDYGTQVHDLIRYNGETKVIIPYGKLIGVEIRK
jgi:hypothetical protein